MDLSFGTVATGTLSQTLCPGDSLTVNGTVYDASNPSGSQTFPNGSWQGCDSMLNVSLSFHPLSVSNQNQVLCTGGSLTVNGVVYDEDNPTGTETIPGGSWLGCDSVLNISLSFQSLNTVDDEFSLALNVQDLQGNLTLNDDLPGNWVLTGVQDPTSGSLVYVGENSGEFTWTATSNVPVAQFTYRICAEGCPNLCDTATATISLELDEASVDEPDGFTPNGDGMNDEFIIPELEDPDAYPDNELTVFNRWGDVVYHAKPYRNRDWDGGGLPAGTYFYIIRLNIAEGKLRMKQVVIIR
ncbi:MAG: gliding motility-associated C-terminal domain-containing protein [Saprospiraceae bacterium]|nr:gliding motility-associated C-terminal domain-containing protein [Saprospiraceae bacterium]